MLYRLPKLIEAVAAGATIHIFEGEKDVHALERTGVVATCNAGGARKGKWRREYTEALRGAIAIIIADRDAEGWKHARAIAEALRGVAASVTIVEAAVGKDASDHLAVGKTVEEFAPMRAPEPEPERTESDENPRYEVGAC